MQWIRYIANLRKDATTYARYAKHTFAIPAGELQNRIWLAFQMLPTEHARTTTRMRPATASTMGVRQSPGLQKADVRDDLLHQGRAACSQWGHQRGTASASNTRDIGLTGFCDVDVWLTVIWWRRMTAAPRPNTIRLNWPLWDTVFKMRGGASSWILWQPSGPDHKRTWQEEDATSYSITISQAGVSEWDLTEVVEGQNQPVVLYETFLVWVWEL